MQVITSKNQKWQITSITKNVQQKHGKKEEKNLCKKNWYAGERKTEKKYNMIIWQHKTRLLYKKGRVWVPCTQFFWQVGQGSKAAEKEGN